MPSIGNVRGGPYVVESSPLIGGIPISRTVRPPAVKKAFRDILSRYVDPATSFLSVTQVLDFDRRMTHNLEKLLVAPNIIFAWSNVQVANKDRLFGLHGTIMVSHLG